MIFRGKRLSGLQEQDLQRLVDDQVQERDFIEYKKGMYGNSDDDKREMLKDITSMANHRGGYIVIGIEADDEGIPTNVIGIEAGNHVERIRSSCLNNIDKRIVGLDIEDISLSNNKVVIVISIPESINAPHMVTYKGLNQFWKRHGRQKEKMTTHEIGEAFDKRLSNLNRLDRFLFLRKTEILENIGEKTFMVISSSPALLLDEAILSVHDENLRRLILNIPKLAECMGTISCGEPHPTINGLRADGSTPYYHNNPPLEEYIEVFTNGFIEYGKLFESGLDGQSRKYFAGIADTASIVNFMGFIQEVYNQYLPLRPLIVNFAIYNAKDMYLAASHGDSEKDRLVRWQKQHLELGKFYTDNISEERKLLTKAICDRLYQAFNRERCNQFDDAGTFSHK
jgi:hypothetical protein